ncbi:MAG: hypothetical protein LQ340_000682 [Diploschistes diacapsis]|nr:MAG: hypothetical protein LQ340_000682 [Diploschistes diacapsis]
MPLHAIGHIIREGSLSAIPYLTTILRTLPWLAFLALLKWYFSGRRNKSERLMRSKVIMITGGTSGIGASLTHSLAARGAQLILLTSQPPSDPFVADYIADLRSSTGNALIWAEHVDLSSLHSIRLFATKWIDNAPPRRLDMLVLCAATMTPRFAPGPIPTADGLEPCWGVNYLANFHLLSILSPALRAQPADRDVRVVFATCGAYVGGDVRGMRDAKAPLPRGREYATSKLALMVFARAFQRHLDAYVRPDKQPNNARVVLVDPGLCRTAGMRRWLSGGGLLGLLVYLVLWPLWWLGLKSAEMGAEGFLYAAMEAELGKGEGGRLVRECREVRCTKAEVGDERVEEELWKFSEGQIKALEKEGAVKRALAKKKGEQETMKGNEEQVGKVLGEVHETATNRTEEKGTNGAVVTGKEQRDKGSRRSRKAR